MLRTKRLTKHLSLKLVLLMAALAFSHLALALDYRSVSSAATIFYDSPSSQGKKLFVVSKFYPVEVIVDLGAWVKVRDSLGQLAWVESSQLATKRTLLVTTDQIDARESADTNARLIFKAQKDVVLEFIEAGSAGWVKVRHKNGLTAYVQASEVWGL